MVAQRGFGVRTPDTVAKPARARPQRRLAPLPRRKAVSFKQKHALETRPRRSRGLTPS